MEVILWKYPFHIYDQEKYIKMSYDAKRGILKMFTKDISFTKDKAI